MLDEARRAARYLTGLPRFLREPMTVTDARTMVRRGLEAREERFVSFLELAVYANPGSPYRPLLAAAGIELGDAAALVRGQGVDAALERLFDAGVRISLGEFRARARSFDNPLVTAAYTSPTGGSTGPARSVMMNFGALERDTAYTALLLDSFGALRRPLGMWRPVPPARAGLHYALHVAKLGGALERWFSQNELSVRRDPKAYAFTQAALLATRRWAKPAPAPEHVPLHRPEPVARWLAECVARGAPAKLHSPASAGVRACVFAREHGLDLTGTLFRVGGEPLTAAKAAAMLAVGARVVCSYSMTEIGRVGIACADAEELDEVHLATDRLAVVQRENALGVGALHFTTLDTSARAVMLNVESGDYGVLVRRRCGCLLRHLGLDLHLHTIRSHDKLTSEGMNIFGADLISLVEDVLPARFGGAPTDYQLAEEEVDGLPRVCVVVSPRVGAVDEQALLAAVDRALRRGPAYKEMMADVWRDGGTLRVVRREPHATSSAKVLPLHLAAGGTQRRERSGAGVEPT